MKPSVPPTAPVAKPLDPFTATDEQLAELFADPEYAAYCAEREHDRATDEAEMARRYESEHAERFGNDVGGDGQFPW